MYDEYDQRGQLKLAISTQIPDCSPFPLSGDYTLIVSDPPWKYILRETDASHRGRTPYPNMSNEDIIQMPVGAIAASDAYLLLWTTNTHLPIAFEAMKRYGFSYKTLYTWFKTTKASTDENPVLKLSTGHYGRGCTEHFLLGTKGNPPCFTTLGLTGERNGMFEPPSRIHSRKPDAFYDLVQRLWSKLGGSAIELFAREPRLPNLEVWGAEAPPIPEAD